MRVAGVARLALTRIGLVGPRPPGVVPHVFGASRESGPGGRVTTVGAYDSNGEVGDWGNKNGGGCGLCGGRIGDFKFQI